MPIHPECDTPNVGNKGCLGLETLHSEAPWACLARPDRLPATLTTGAPVLGARAGVGARLLDVDLHHGRPVARRVVMLQREQPEHAVSFAAEVASRFTTSAVPGLARVT